MSETQREEDARLGRPLEDHYTEDPRLRGMPLFLQHQNRRPADPVKLQALRDLWAEARFGKSGLSPTQPTAPPVRRGIPRPKWNGGTHD